MQARGDREELAGEMAFGQRLQRRERRAAPLDSANKNRGQPVQVEFWINKDMHYLGHTKTIKFFAPSPPTLQQGPEPIKEGPSRHKSRGQPFRLSEIQVLTPETRKLVSIQRLVRERLEQLCLSQPQSSAVARPLS